MRTRLLVALTLAASRGLTDVAATRLAHGADAAAPNAAGRPAAARARERFAKGVMMEIGS